MRPCVGALGGRPEVQGIRQGAQGAAPSPGSLGPPWGMGGGGGWGGGMGWGGGWWGGWGGVGVGGGGGGQTICYVGACCAMQNSTEFEQIGNIYSKRIFLAHIITNSSANG